MHACGVIACGIQRHRDRRPGDGARLPRLAVAARYKSGDSKSRIRVSEVYFAGGFLLGVLDHSQVEFGFVVCDVGQTPQLFGASRLDCRNRLFAAGMSPSNIERTPRR